jgi:DNA invertase Pin-like site-specific DNA recombinase
VVGGTATYQTVLVYDVSRWGRFQDSDESAHYEFLCKSAGVPVHYCAETFANDGSLPSLLMKALKRTMAGEYSRELSVKVLAGQRRLASLGFKQGGAPGYGLRRMLVSSNREPKQLLTTGERKSIATDRVILVPGPAHEVQAVRSIYRMLVSDGLSVYAIARELNLTGVEYIGTSQWDYQAVYGILIHPKYAGFHTFGRTSSKLHTPSVSVPKSEWTITAGAFEPIVDYSTFLEAQRILEGRTINKSDEQLLGGLRLLLTREERLSLRLIENSLDLPSPSTYRKRFGSLRHAYELIGYRHPDKFGPIDLRRRTQGLREQLIATIVTMLPHDFSVIRRGGRWRTRLRLRNGLIVSVLVARSIKIWKGAVRWQIAPVRRELNHVTLLARLDEENRFFLDFHVMPRIERQTRFHIRRDDTWLSQGLRLNALSELCNAVHTVRLKSANRR